MPGGLAWNADKLSLRVALQRPDRLEVAPAGRQTLRLGANPAVDYTAENMRAIMPTEPSPPPFIDFAAGGLQVSTPLRGDPSATTTTGSLRAHLSFRPDAPAGEPAIGITLRADDTTPPPELGRILGPHIASATLDAALDGPVAPTSTIAQGAAAWRDAGGKIELRHIALTWDPLDVTAGGTLALDRELQPEGTGNARVLGYDQTLDALASHAVISRSAATAAKAVLSLLATAPPNGAPPDVEVPLSLRSRTLSMHEVPLLRLPEIDWR